MSDNKYVLAMYDVRGKQEFIFRTNKLQEIVGASWIIRDVFKDYLFPTAKEAGTKGIYVYNPKEKYDKVTFTNRIEKENYIGEVVYEGGGNFFVLFKNRDVFQDITYRFTSKLMKAVGTLQVQATCVEIEDFTDFKGDQKRLYEEHRKTESRESSIAPWSCLPIVQVDRKTSQPLVDYSELCEKLDKWIKEKLKNKGEKGKLTKESAAKLIKYYSEIKRIGNKGESELTETEKVFLENETILDKLVTEKGKDSKLAVVYIDGNNMGAKVEQRTNNASTKGYDDQIKVLRDFSQSIQETYVTEGVEKALEGIDENRFRIVVSAGDEINFIVNAHDAFKCATQYLDYLKEKDQSASSCAGIAVFNSHAPYADVYRLAEEACESGKKKMKELGVDNAAFIDFHVCQGAIGLSLDRIRKEENGKIISRPWMMWNRTKFKKSDVCVTDYHIVEKIKKVIFRFSRSNVKGLLSAAKESKVALLMELNRMYGHLKKEEKAKLETEWGKLKEELKNDDDKNPVIRSIIYDISLAYDLWFRRL